MRMHDPKVRKEAFLFEKKKQKTFDLQEGER
jgi:hypothetical protein